MGRKLHIRLVALLTALLLCGCSQTSKEALLKGKTDLMATAQALAGYDQFSGFSPKSYGVGTFEDYTRLHANPLDTAEYALGLREASRKILPDTAGLETFSRAVMKEYGFHMDFTAPSTGSGSFEEAMQALFRAAGQEDGYEAALTLGDRLTEAAKAALTDYLWAAADALTRNRQACGSILPMLWKTLAEFTMTAPATADVSGIRTAYQIWKSVDERELLASGQQMIAASARLVRAVSGLEKLTHDGGTVAVDTPAGKIIIGSAGDDRYADTGAFLHIDPGGNDVYEGAVAVSTAEYPVSVLMDLGGNDTYRTESGASQGCGILGTGLLYDLSGDDSYEAGALSQGAAHIGTGMLFDGSGNDSYTATTSCQGSATYGFALNIDLSGDDRYKARGYAQAYAGNRAVALLVNSGGADDYYAEPEVEPGWEDLTYDQFPGIAGNWSQGCGAGNRSFDPEGNHGLSGGVAALLDLGSQPDRYVGGIWVMGVGYWSGVGLLLDDGGNDLYDSKYYCQASVAHYGVGMMLDMGQGNDVHRMIRKDHPDGGQGAALGFVWDYGTALFVNEAGNDVYSAQNFSCGVSWAAYDPAGPEQQQSSYAIFLDCSGQDTYSQLSGPAYGYGKGGFFLDLEGTDKYGQTGRKNRAERCDGETCGGVFLDYGEDTDGLAFFWEKAKMKYADERK